MREKTIKTLNINGEDRKGCWLTNEINIMSEYIKNN